MYVSVEYWIMNACNNNNNFICTLHWLHDTKKLDKNIERVEATHNNHLGLKR